MIRNLVSWSIPGIIVLGCDSPGSERIRQPQPGVSAIRLLMFTKTAGYRHESIPHAVDSLSTIAPTRGITVTASEDSSLLDASHLSEFDVIVFLNTTGDILTDAQQAAFESWFHDGGGFVGIHAAADTEYDWEWYGRLVGARFDSHPAVQPATIYVFDREHPSTDRVPALWKRVDEWYNFDSHPRKRLGANCLVLATIDESTYTGGTMGKDHPVVWCHEFEGGRVWYTAGGHTSESYDEPEFLNHVFGGIMWAAGKESQVPTH